MRSSKSHIREGREFCLRVTRNDGEVVASGRVMHLPPLADGFSPVEKGLFRSESVIVNPDFNQSCFTQILTVDLESSNSSPEGRKSRLCVIHVVCGNFNN